MRKEEGGERREESRVLPLAHTLLVLRRQMVLVGLVRWGPQSVVSLRAWALAMRCAAYRLDEIATNQERAEDGAAVVSD